jgi:hypothetical protein
MRNRIDKRIGRHAAILAILTGMILACVVSCGGGAVTMGHRFPGYRETCRAMLENDRGEAPGYGLYSYILFASRPDEASRPLYVKLVQSYLELSERDEVLRYFPAEAVNVTYLPIRIGREGTDEGNLRNAEWLVDNYNYARARRLLRSIAGEHSGGPYIVSSLVPLTGVTVPLRREYLIQDMTGVAPRLVGPWMKLFLGQAEKERFWDRSRMGEFVLNLRNGMIQLGGAVDSVYGAMEKWEKLIKWI